MTIQQIIEKFLEQPERMRMGAGKLALRYKTSINDIYAARDLARKQIMNSTHSGPICPSVKKEIVRQAVQEVMFNDARYECAKKLHEESTKIAAATKSYLNRPPEPFKGGDVRNVLVIGDTHEPFCIDGYLEFCREQQEKYNCGTVVHIGDLVDNHAISYHEHTPEGRSAGDEYLDAMQKCKRWYHTFPCAKVCIGNHDALPFRKAFTAGLPAYWLKSYQELLESPKEWEWDFVHEVNGVIYQHGTGMSGEMASINAARENRQSTVIGHLHTVCNTRFLASHKDLIFGTSVGCGIDHHTYAFAYGRENTRKPVVSCAVILDGKTPINIPMLIS